jgi:aryl-alcohol dehydrogenase
LKPQPWPSSGCSIRPRLSQSATLPSLEALASRGELAMLAVTAPGTEITFNPNTLLGGRSLRGAVEGDADPQSFIPWLIDRHRAGRFNHAPLVTEYPLAAINEAVADMASGRAVKPVLVMD